MHVNVQDFRSALRQLRRSPGFTLTAVLTLALGIGPLTAIFVVFQQVMLRELPVADPHGLVLLEEHSAFETGSLSTNGGSSDLYFTYPAYQALRDRAEQARVLRGIAAEGTFPAKIVTEKDTDQTYGQMVSGNYFALLQVRPVLGRVLTAEDDREGDPNPVAVLSEAYWRSHFGADTGLLNHVVEVNGVALTIVGVVRHGGLMDANQRTIFVPITMQPQVLPNKGNILPDALNRWIVLIARTAPGVARAQAGAVLNAAWWNWRRDALRERKAKISDAQGWLRTHLVLEDGARGISLLSIELGQPVTELQAMALLVLLIACANLANLLLARGARSRSELAVRAALGATRTRIAAQQITEAMLVGAAGTAAGLLLGWGSLRLLANLLGTSQMGGMARSAQWYWPVLVFGIGAGLLTSLLFSLVPAFVSARVNPAELLHGQPGVTSNGRTRLRSLLVSAEIALCVLLLASASLFGWNLYQLRHTDPGFRIAHILTYRVDASAGGTPDATVAATYDEILQGLDHEAGVQQAAYSSQRMLSRDENGANITVAGYVERGQEQDPYQNWISPNFFSTLSIPLLRGRIFAQSDGAGTQHVAIVDQAFVQHYYGGDAARAMAGHFGFGSADFAKPDIAIVGIVPAIHMQSLSSMPRVPFIYLPYAQTYSAPGVPARREHPANFYLRTAGDPAALAADVHALVHRVDRTLPVDDLATMQEQFQNSFADTQATAVLTLFMGALALLLAAVGMYGVLAYLVTTRRHEIGVRMAVGAARCQVVALVLQQVARIAAGGICAGAVLTWIVLHLLAGNVGELVRGPLWLYVLPVLAITSAALLAASTPAFRAASVNPAEVLRAE